MRLLSRFTALLLAVLLSATPSAGQEPPAADPSPAAANEAALRAMVVRRLDVRVVGVPAETRDAVIACLVDLLLTLSPEAQAMMLSLDGALDAAQEAEIDHAHPGFSATTDRCIAMLDGAPANAPAPVMPMAG